MGKWIWSDLKQLNQKIIFFKTDIIFPWLIAWKYATAGSISLSLVRKVLDLADNWKVIRSKGCSCSENWAQPTTAIRGLLVSSRICTVSFHTFLFPYCHCILGGLCLHFPQSKRKCNVPSHHTKTRFHSPFCWGGGGRGGFGSSEYCSSNILRNQRQTLPSTKLPKEYQVFKSQW